MKKLEIVPETVRANREVVKLLEELLVKAKAGEIVDFVSAFKFKDGESGSCFSPTVDNVYMIGLTARLLWKLQKRMDKMNGG